MAVMGYSERLGKAADLMPAGFVGSSIAPAISVSAIQESPQVTAGADRHNAKRTPN
jgi:hypothetical protein